MTGRSREARFPNLSACRQDIVLEAKYRDPRDI